MMLEIKNLNVYYGAIHALKGVDLHLDKGEIVALIGSNGAGKSTTLNTISGILQPKVGSVTFEGQDITQCPAQDIVKMGIIQVPEGRKIFTKMTVQENLEMGAYLNKNKEQIGEDIEKSFQMFPTFERTPQTIRRHTFRRRTTNACHGPRLDEPPGPAPAG